MPETAADTAQTSSAEHDEAGPDPGDGAKLADSSELYAEDLAIPEDIDVDLVMRYMGLDWSQSNLERVFAEDEDLHREREDKIFECMRDHGFEYTRQPSEDPRGQLLSDEHGEVGTRTWHQWYGRGISTMRFPQEVLPADLAGYSSELLFARSLAHESDLSSLTVGEQQAYNQALFGDAEIEGCSTQAWNQTNNDFGLMVRTWGELLIEVEERVRTSEPMVDYEAGLVECVREKGFSEFTGSQDHVDDIRARLDALGANGGEGSEDLSSDAIEALRDIQQLERDVVIAELDCRPPQDEEIALFRSAVEAVLDEHR